MSADNGIYILRTVRNRHANSRGGWDRAERHYVWRVAHVQAVDNLDFYKEEQLYNLGAYMNTVWGTSPVFLSQEEALVDAKQLADDMHKAGVPLEYGITSIDTDYIFYGDH